MTVILPFSTTTVSRGLLIWVLAVCSGNLFVKQVFGEGRRRASRVVSSVLCWSLWCVRPKLPVVIPVLDWPQSCTEFWWIRTTVLSNENFLPLVCPWWGDNTVTKEHYVLKCGAGRAECMLGSIVGGRWSKEQKVVNAYLSLKGKAIAKLYSHFCPNKSLCVFHKKKKKSSPRGWYQGESGCGSFGLLVQTK